MIKKLIFFVWFNCHYSSHEIVLWAQVVSLRVRYVARRLATFAQVQNVHAIFIYLKILPGMYITNYIIIQQARGKKEAEVGYVTARLGNQRRIVKDSLPWSVRLYDKRRELIDISLAWVVLLGVFKAPRPRTWKCVVQCSLCEPQP